MGRQDFGGGAQIAKLQGDQGFGAIGLPTPTEDQLFGGLQYVP